MLKCKFFSFLIICFAALTANAQDSECEPKKFSVEAEYIHLTVRGVLSREQPRYVVMSADSNFPKLYKVKVILERTEDKNRSLDSHLKKLEGKTVIVCGGLDTRRLGKLDGTIYLYLSDISQLKLAPRAEAGLNP